jgi:hypothetical protein
MELRLGHPNVRIAPLSISRIRRTQASGEQLVCNVFLIDSAAYNPDETSR